MTIRVQGSHANRHKGARLSTAVQVRGWLELVMQGASGADGRVRRRRLGADNNHLMDSVEHVSGWTSSNRN